MKLKYIEKHFVLTGSVQEMAERGGKAVPKAAGFCYSKEGEQPLPKYALWWTDDPSIAVALVRYATDKAKAALHKMDDERRKAIESSRATSATLDVPAEVMDGEARVGSASKMDVEEALQDSQQATQKTSLPLPDRKYQIIYADPPWGFNFHKRQGLSDEAKARLYSTMTPADIKALPVADIAADNSMLFLWVMNSELPLALDVIQAWGFTFVTVGFVWAKTTTTGKWHFGGGNWTRSNPELCLIAKKGVVPRRSASVRTLVVAPLREHSRKPEEVKAAIVELIGDVPRIELFARQTTLGWDVWGDEVS